MPGARPVPSANLCTVAETVSRPCPLWVRDTQGQAVTISGEHRDAGAWCRNNKENLGGFLEEAPQKTAGSRHAGALYWRGSGLKPANFRLNTSCSARDLVLGSQLLKILAAKSHGRPHHFLLTPRPPVRIAKPLGSLREQLGSERPVPRSEPHSRRGPRQVQSPGHWSQMGLTEQERTTNWGPAGVPE